MGACYGYFSPTGTKRVVVCDDSCPVGRYQLIKSIPRLFDWSGGPEGDFASAIGPMAATLDTASRLQAFGLESEEIAVHWPRGKEGKRLAGSYRLLRPSVAPPAHWKTTQTPDQTCPKCGRIRTGTLIGYEELGSIVKNDQCVPIVEKPRQPEHGLYITRSSLERSTFFSYGEMLLCTSGGRQWIENEGLSNVCFAEYGEIVDE